MKHWLFICLFWFSSASAHELSNGYLSLSLQDQASIKATLALRDLALIFPLDENLDGDLTWGELKVWRGGIADYLRNNVNIMTSNVAPCTIGALDLAVDEKAGVAYAVLSGALLCAQGDRISVDYRLFFDINQNHRGVITLSSNAGQETGIASPERSNVGFSLQTPSYLHQFVDFFKSGAHHIQIGLDHILFLAALLLPIVFARNTNTQAASLRAVLTRLALIISAFTLGHTISLGLAVTGLVHLPEQWVETAIAASIVITVVANYLQWWHHRALIAVVFGLVHGLGFAAALEGVTHDIGALATALLGFNLGAEAAQLGMILSAVLALYWIRHFALVRFAVYHTGQMAIIVIALIWMVERVVGIEVLAI